MKIIDGFFKNSEGGWIKKKIAIAVSIIIVLIFVAIIFCYNIIFPTYTVESTYERYNYEDVVVTDTFLIEGQPAKEAVYAEEKVTLTSTNGSGDSGGDHNIPANATKVVGSEDLCWESFSVSGEPKSINGDTCAETLGVMTINALAAQDIKLGYDKPKAGDGVRIMSGEIYYVVPGEEITPAQPATEDKTVDIQITQQYDDATGEKTDAICVEDNVEVECSKMHGYDELSATIDGAAKNIQTSDTVTETLEYDTHSKVWTATSDGEVVKVEELVNYDTMKKEIDLLIEE